MQYSLLVSEIVFYNPCNIMMDGAYKIVGRWEGAGGGWVGGWVGGQAKGGRSLLLGHKQ